MHPSKSYQNMLAQHSSRVSKLSLSWNRSGVFSSQSSKTIFESHLSSLLKNLNSSFAMLEKGEEIFREVMRLVSESFGCSVRAITIKQLRNLPLGHPPPKMLLTTSFFARVKVIYLLDFEPCGVKTIVRANLNIVRPERKQVKEKIELAIIKCDKHRQQKQ